MKHSQRPKFPLILLGFLQIFLALACVEEGKQAPIGHTIAPELESFYKYMDGEQFLGIAISKPFTQDGLLYQYTVAGLLIYNPQTGDAFLAPLALEWGISDPDETPPTDPSTPYVNGHRIWEEVLPYYEKYGTKTLGLPLTAVQFNEDKQRYEQYFERVGFYRNGSDAVGQVHLMPYGDWMCGGYCFYEAYDAIPTAAPSSEVLQVVDQAFLEAAERWGYELTGRPLSTAYQTPDGLYEKVFENVVLYLDPQSSRVGLAPLAQRVNIVPDPPVPHSDVPGMNFYVIQGEVGYNIPQHFPDYITALAPRFRRFITEPRGRRRGRLHNAYQLLPESMRMPGWTVRRQT
jgi:hypothetical protein